MTLLVTALAAVGTTILWYRTRKKRDVSLGILCLIYWGASLMWLVDAVFLIREEGAAAFFHPDFQQLRSDLILGLCAVALGLIIWVIAILWKRYHHNQSDQ